MNIHIRGPITTQFLLSVIQLTEVDYYHYTPVYEYKTQHVRTQMTTYRPSKPVRWVIRLSAGEQGRPILLNEPAFFSRCEMRGASAGLVWIRGRRVGEGGHRGRRSIARLKIRQLSYWAFFETRITNIGRWERLSSRISKMLIWSLAKKIWGLNKMLYRCFAPNSLPWLQERRGKPRIKWFAYLLSLSSCCEMRLL